MSAAIPRAVPVGPAPCWGSQARLSAASAVTMGDVAQEWPQKSQRALGPGQGVMVAAEQGDGGAALSCPVLPWKPAAVPAVAVHVPSAPTPAPSTERAHLFWGKLQAGQTHERQRSRHGPAGKIDSFRLAFKV